MKTFTLISDHYNKTFHLNDDDTLCLLKLNYKDVTKDTLKEVFSSECENVESISFIDVI